MIPIRINKVELKISSIESLEYKYLVEIPQDIRDKWETFRGNYNDDDVDNNKLLSLFTDNGFETFRFIGTIGESNLFISEGDLYTADKDKDFVYYSRGYGDDIGFMITDEVLKDIVGKKFECGWRGHDAVREILDKYKDKEIGIGDFIQRFLAYGLKKKAKELREEKKIKVEKEEEIKGNEEEIEEFDNGEWKHNGEVYASVNVIYSYGGEYTFRKDVKNVFTLEELNRAKSGYNRWGIEKLNWIESLCVEKCASYSFISKDKKRTYKVNFKKDKMYVDNVCVPKVRSAFFISRASGDSAKLRVLKELSAVKVEFLALDNIGINTDSYSYNNIPIEIKYTDKLFEITLLDKTIKADWKDLELFRYNIQRLKTTFYTSDINDIRELFGIDKADLFDFMKKIQLLDKLGEEDD